MLDDYESACTISAVAVTLPRHASDELKVWWDDNITGSNAYDIFSPKNSIHILPNIDIPICDKTLQLVKWRSQNADKNVGQLLSCL